MNEQFIKPNLIVLSFTSTFANTLGKVISLVKIMSKHKTDNAVNSIIMRILGLFIVFLLVTFELPAQTLIATSKYSQATANHNQRKIVRDLADNVYVVYVDSTEQGKIIKGIKFDESVGIWNNATYITKGSNPTLSINSKGKIHLVFESTDSIVMIKHMSSLDFSNWTTENIISDSALSSVFPVSDTDLSGNLNVFWIEKNNSISMSLIYACLNEDTLSFKKPVVTKSKIEDIAVANHLQYYSDVLIFAIQFSLDSIQFFRTIDNMESFDTIYTAIGSQPCASYNSYNGGDHVFKGSSIRMLYIDTLSHLIEVESTVSSKNDNQITVRQLSTTPTNYVCIDDVLPPIGYSFLFMQDDKLFHGFSCGAEYGWYIVLDTIQNNPIFPSLAYKSFSYNHVDYVWMQKNGSEFDILYQRSDKFRDVGVEDFEIGKGFKISGYPNPFSERIRIDVTIEKPKEEPVIKIYNTNSQLIRTLNLNQYSVPRYSYFWDGTDQNNFQLSSGTYIIVCTVGNIRTTRKILYLK